MNDISKLSDSLEDTIKSSELKNISIDVAELAFDGVMEDGLIKDIPVIGTLMNIIKLTGNIRDRLFAKKLIHFLTELSETTPEERTLILINLEGEKNYDVKVGEKLLYIIDRCEDHVKAKIMAKLFSAFIRNDLTYSEFLHASSIVDKTYIEDFRAFLLTTYSDQNIEEAGHLIVTGLYDVATPSVSVRDQDDWKNTSESYIVDSELIVYVSSIGEKIRKILKSDDL